ncbi:transposase [Pseudoalteromonas sp. TAE80]|uniref:transposase n=1 Tax=Pseudoalteromonas sp. TAE80 TaxID=1938598 RepID=UPI00406CC3CA
MILGCRSECDRTWRTPDRCRLDSLLIRLSLLDKLKGKSSYMLKREYWGRIKTMLWGNHFWSPSYCVMWWYELGCG